MSHRSYRYAEMEGLTDSELKQVLDLSELSMQGDQDARAVLRKILHQSEDWPKTMLDNYLVMDEAYHRMSPSAQAREDSEISVRTECVPVPAQLNRNKVLTKLARLRIDKGLSQGQLAQASGVNVMMISRLERMERAMDNTTLDTAIKLADALGVDDIRDLR